VRLNVVDILKDYPGKVLFICAEKDRLVSDKVAENLLNIAAKSLILVEIPAAHDAILFDTKLLIQPISSFLQDSS